MQVVIGEALLDLVATDQAGGYRAQPAGGPLNTAVGLARLGHPTAFVGRISRGSLGARIRRYAASERLDLSGAVLVDAPVTLAFATPDAAGVAAYEFYVDGCADFGWTDDELGGAIGGLREAVSVHTGSLAAALDPGAEALLGLWRWLAADGRAFLSFDPNVRPGVLPDRARARDRVEAFVAASHVVKASDDDIGWLYPELGLEQVVEGWLAQGTGLVVVTRGAAGATAATADGWTLELPARPVRVVDTIGAGDSFMSGLLSGLVDAGAASPAALARPDHGVVREAVQRGLDVSALTCTKPGAQPPTRDELGR